MTDKLRTETTQVAAVAAAILEDLGYGEANAGATVGGLRSNKTQVSKVLDRVARERYAQDEKWGAQHHDPLTWLMILLEEVGEMAREVPIEGNPASNAAGNAGSIRAGAIHIGDEAMKWLKRNLPEQT